MALDYIPGRGWVFRGGGGGGGAVGGGNAFNGEAEANRIAQVEKQRAQFQQMYGWDPARDYQDSWSKAFGIADPGGVPSFGNQGGPNNDPLSGLMGRLDKRRLNDYSSYSHWENGFRTASDDYRADQYGKINAIEDMYRNGFSQSQIKRHMNGENVLSEGADWSDYNAEYQRAGAGDNWWGANYFKGTPGMLSGAGGQPENSPTSDPNSNPTSSSPRRKRLGTWGSGYKDGGYGMLSGENDQMRQAIATALEKKLLG